MKKPILVAAIASLLFTSPLWAAEKSCKDFTPAILKRAINIFHDTTKSESQKRQSLSVLFGEAVDTDWIGKFVLGNFWKTASNEEQAQYLKNYRVYVTHTYISKFNDEDAMAIEDMVLSSLVPKGAGMFEAKTLIKQKEDEDAKVDYLLDESGGKCQVHDIIVEGVSLLTSQRAEFTTLAASSGVKGVINAMEKKLAN